MTLLQVLATAPVASSPTMVDGIAVTLSTSAVVGMIIALIKLSTLFGRFQEFKETTERDGTSRTALDRDLVRRHEIETLGHHIDTRFNALEKLIGERRAAADRRAATERD